MPPKTPETEPFVMIHRNFPDRYRCRVARRLGVPAKTLVAYYTVAHDIASGASTFGEFTTDVRAFEEAIGEPERFGTSARDVERDAELADIWRKLEQAQLIEIIDGDPMQAAEFAGLPSEFRVRVNGMRSAPKSAPVPGAKRTAKWRENQKAAAQVECDAENTAHAGIVTRCDERVTCDDRREEKYRPASHLAAVPESARFAAELGRQAIAMRDEDRRAGIVTRKKPSGVAREALAEIPWSDRGERLHVTEGSGQSVSGPGESSATASSDALGGAA